MGECLLSKRGGSSSPKQQTVTVHGAVYETINLSIGGSVETDASGVGTASVPLGLIQLTGSTSGQSFIETVTADTTDVYCMPQNALYWYGNECINITGGWDNSGYSHNNVSANPFTKNTNSMSVSMPVSSFTMVGTVNSIGTTGFNNLIVNGDASGYSGETTGLGFSASKSNAHSNNVAYNGDNMDVPIVDGRLYNLSISSINNNYYAFFLTGSSKTKTITVKEIYME